MDTNRLKKFATEARNILKCGVAAKMLSLGFDDNGHIDESEMPILIQGGSIFRGQQHTEAFYHQWMSLHKRIEEKGIKEVYEEAAYTWFNRFIAIRILQKNGLAEPVLDFVDVARTPHIVDAARMGHHPQMSAADEEQLRTLLSDVSAVTPQFSHLITAYCHNNPIIYKCFGGIADYTELLLPNDILAENGFIDTLNHTEFITNEDFASPELIGWLYQFYISERKNEVFSKSGKWDADEIPAATQIFTPNWIVKYMVQNTVGRIYLDNNPWATDLKDKWKYLVEPSEPTPDEAKLKYKDLTELRVGDLACGSGHILNECFDLLFDLYIEDGYSRSEAIEAIFKYNLTGIDLDTRAKQLATFALLLKACQRDRSFADAHVMPNILNMPEPQKDEEALTTTLHHFFKGSESRQDITSLLDAFKLMRNADSLGSIMIFDIPGSTRALIKQTVEYYDAHADQQEYFTEILPAMRLILALTEKYHALVMNPPYMGAKHMDNILSNYATQKYPNSKIDLFAMFMDLSYRLLTFNGKYGMINMQAWMYNTYFVSLRTNLLNEQNIDSLLHLGPHTFDELSGEIVQNVTFVITKHNPIPNHTTFIRLVSGENCNAKERLFLEKDTHLIFSNVKQSRFSKIKLCPMGSYGASDTIISLFEDNPIISDITNVYQGLSTAANGLFMRNWYEVSRTCIRFKCKTHEESLKEKEKWYPVNKGGGQRKWYGNQIEVINWQRDGYAIKNFKSAIIRAEECFFKPTVTWNKISGAFITFRYYPEGFVLDSASNAIPCEDKYESIIAFLSSKISNVIAQILNATTNLSNGVVARFPYLNIEDKTILNDVHNSISISRDDWNAHETSWDFKKNELLTMDEETLFKHIDYYCDKVYKETGEQLCIDPVAPEPDSIEWCYNMYCDKWADKFDELHRNEEELNRQFIDIYGLQDELTPEVPLNEITILQQGEISIEGNELKWHPDVVMKQLISYAVGCWMGRYRLDKPGLHIAHPNPTDEEVCTYKYGDSQLRIDDDGIIPILSADSAFDDNLAKRVQEFIRIAFGAEKVNQNISFVEACLGTSLEKYLQRDFWKDHKKMYQNRPIYWLFSSKKGAFQCLAYMHRMDANTADKVRSNYLMKHMDWLRQSIAGLEANAITLNTAERNKLKKLRNDLVECEEYNDRLQLIADRRIAFDLDDGVVVNYAKFGDVLAKLK